MRGFGGRGRSDQKMKSRCRSDLILLIKARSGVEGPKSAGVQICFGRPDHIRKCPKSCPSSVVSGVS